jgi:hypothetical protein
MHSNNLPHPAAAAGGGGGAGGGEGQVQAKRVVYLETTFTRCQWLLLLTGKTYRHLLLCNAAKHFWEVQLLLLVWFTATLLSLLQLCIIQLLLLLLAQPLLC